MSQLAQFTSSVTALARRGSRISAFLWWFMLLSCRGIVVYATRFSLATPSDEHFSRYLLPLRLHIAGGMGALLAGPWQFSQKLRARALNLRRWLGRFYLLEVALGSVAGLAMALVSEQVSPHIWASEFWPCCGFSPVSKRTAPCAAETSKLTVGG
jgi:hypothetical protein